MLRGLTGNLNAACLNNPALNGPALQGREIKN
jgi:hypothetical protein